MPLHNAPGWNDLSMNERTGVRQVDGRVPESSVAGGDDRVCHAVCPVKPLANCAVPFVDRHPVVPLPLLRVAATVPITST